MTGSKSALISRRGNDGMAKYLGFFDAIKLEFTNNCNYSDYNKFNKASGAIRMEKQIRVMDIKLIPIGNSKGIRIPKPLIQKYGFNNSLFLEETERGLLLRKKEGNKLSWEDTYKAMAIENEDWDDFDTTLLDGVEDEDFEY